MRISLFATLTLTTVLAAPLSAQTRPGFSVSADLFDSGYRERQDAETVVREDGVFGGTRITYLETLGGKTFLRSRLGVSVGSVRYLGSAVLGGSQTSQAARIRQSEGTLEVHVGLDIPISPRTSLAPYAGLGGRYLSDESGGTTTDDGLQNYDREADHGYLPIGITVHHKLTPNVTIQLAGQYNEIVRGSSTARLSQIDARLPDVSVTQNRGSGYELGALAKAEIGRHAIAFGPFVRRWHLPKSSDFLFVDPDGSGEALVLVKPASVRTHAGVRLEFSF